MKQILLCYSSLDFLDLNLDLLLQVYNIKYSINLDLLLQVYNIKYSMWIGLAPLYSPINYIVNVGLISRQRFIRDECIDNKSKYEVNIKYLTFFLTFQKYCQALKYKKCPISMVSQLGLPANETFREKTRKFRRSENEAKFRKTAKCENIAKKRNEKIFSRNAKFFEMSDVS